MDKDIRLQIKAELSENGISEHAYAKIFTFLNYSKAEGMCYIKGKNIWQIEGESVSELRLMALMLQTCDAIREVIKEEWEESLFSSLLPEKAITKVYDQLDVMESLPSASKILKIASKLMALRSDGDVQWDNEEDT